ncbi:hypothetical protein HETIRDRAFT_107512, partial [Heterobasidion irregulare TC 32-1]
MAPHLCQGCRRDDFKSEKGLKRHIRSCMAYLEYVKGIITRKRTWDEETTADQVTKRACVEDGRDKGEGSSQQLVRDLDNDMYVDVENQRIHISDLPQPLSQAPDSSTHSGHSGHAVHFPRRFDDFVPVAPTPLAHIPNITRAQNPGVADATLILPPPPSAEQLHPSASTPEPPKPIITKPNGFGLFRRYPTQPTIDPESSFSLDSICDTPTLAQTNQTAASRGPETNSGINGSKDWFFPFSNYSSAKIAGWHYSGSSDKSIGETNRLVEALRDPRFDVKELVKFNLNQENERLDRYLNDIDNPFSGEDGWLKVSVKIWLPKTGKKFPSESAAPQFEVKDIHHRRLIDIIKGTLSDPVAQTFHM